MAELERLPPPATLDEFESQVAQIRAQAIAVKPHKVLVLSKAQCADILEHICRGGFLLPKMAALGFTQMAWYHRMKAEPELAAAYAAARQLAAQRYLAMGDALAAEGKSTSWPQFQLAKRMPRQFGERGTLDVTVTHKAKLIGSELTLEEAEELAAEVIDE